jgi:cytoskeletal protein CcmA (bactofilin family)
MFQSRKKNREFAISTLIGNDTEINGGLAFKGGLHIDGIVKGSVTAHDDPTAVMTLGPRARIEGDVRVARVILDGTVVGDVYSSVSVELAPNARVMGNIYYHVIEMTIGAEVNGQLIHAEEKVPEPVCT